MSTQFPSRVGASPADLLDRWQADRRARAEAVLGDAREASADAPRPALVVPHSPSGDDAGRAVLAALAAQLDEQNECLPVGTAAPLEDPAPPALGAAAGTTPSEVGDPEVEADSPRASAPAPTTVRVPAADGRVAAPPGLVLFSPRRGARRALTVLAILAVAGLAVAGPVAWQARTGTTYAVAGGLTALVVALWSARGRATGTQVSIEDGVLRVVQGASQHRFPLTGTYPPIDVVGDPGHRGWKVLIQRKGMAPYAVTRSMVDPAEFTDAIRRFRPRA